MRIEKDSLGEILVDQNVYWGAQTERSRQNFKIGSEKMPQSFIHAFAILKKAAALTNCDLGTLPESIVTAITCACDDILMSKMDDQFPLVIWQTGSGTQTNMNLNEVIANRGNEILGGMRGTKTPIHPNDHVNHGQSSNDSFPTAMHMATALQLHHQLFPALKDFSEVLHDKKDAFKAHIKVARTHLQDATPMTVGQEFSGYAAQIDLGYKRLESCLPRLYALAQGGTAVGTGVNCPKGFAEKFAQRVAVLTGLPFYSAANKFEALACHDTLVEISGALNVLAVSCLKIANDIRFLSSGPRCGLGELFLPENEPGSSIMPGKVNPTQAEALTMVCCQVMGNHTTITIAGSQGHFELNVFKPVIIHNILQSITLLTDAIRSFTKNCLNGIVVNDKQLKRNVEQCLMLATALNPVIGYDSAAKVVKKALQDNVSLKEAAVALSLLSATAFDEAIDLQRMVGE